MQTQTNLTDIQKKQILELLSYCAPNMFKQFSVINDTTGGAVFVFASSGIVYYYHSFELIYLVIPNKFKFKWTRLTNSDFNFPAYLVVGENFNHYIESLYGFIKIISENFTITLPVKTK